MSIVEVSKTAGVSIATVSRVLNRRRYVSAAKIKAVEDAMARIGYAAPAQRHVGRPRLYSSGLRTGQIAVLFPDAKRLALRTALSGRLLHGIEEALQKQSLTMVVTGLSESGAIPACVQKGTVDGVIVRTTSRIDESVNLGSDVPSVWMFQSPLNTDCEHDRVLEDNARVGEIAADWLLQKGHRRLAFVNLNGGHPSFRVRGLFFRDVASRGGAAVTSVECSLISEGETALRALMQAPDHPTGIFVPGSDDEVMACYRILNQLGFKVGDGLHLISCNNDPHRLAALDAGLVNIDIRPESIGRAAVDLLLWRIQHLSEARRGMLVPPVLVEPSA